jgi:D-tyrosyl-tRNA(Tyr) deacylase
VKAVVQRVSEARVYVEDTELAAIGHGFLVHLGVAPADTPEVAHRMAAKVANLRVFEDGEGRMNRSLSDVGGKVLCVSQFTLYADVRRGNRPSFAGAAPGDLAEPLYEAFCQSLEAHGLRCARGAFGRHMRVSLTNDGPVTIIIDSETFEQPRRA